MKKYALALDDLTFKYQRLCAMIDGIESAAAAGAGINNNILDFALYEIAEEFRHANDALESLSAALLKSTREEKHRDDQD